MSERKRQCEHCQKVSRDVDENLYGDVLCQECAAEVAYDVNDLEHEAEGERDE